MASLHIWLLLAGTAIGLGVAALLSAYVFGSVAQRRRGEESRALAPAPDGTALDRLIHGAVSENPGKSGLKLAPHNVEAFRARLETARRAGRSLDLQYYYWKNDLTGRILMREIIAAAERGVRVRILIDDINSLAFDTTYLALDSHPNIEVRLFNPSRSRDNPLRRGVEIALKYFTATRRMHNKCWIADGRVMIAGGRNIGDAYFDAAETSNFQDIDVIGIGACVATASAVFDRYWNSEPAVPIRLLRNRMRRPRLARLQRRLAIHCAGDRPRAYLAMAEHEPPCLDDLSGFEWTSAAEIIADPPEKASGKGHEHWLCSRFDPMIEGVKHTLLLISPYFIPGRTASATLARLARRGADIRILTNSLAATDVIAVHGAYARYRRTLVATGIALYELKPEPGRGRASLFGSRTASLHTKAFLIDDEDAFVGSFNLDPRSRSINTEMGILFRCPALTRQLRAIFEAQTRPESSYRLALENGRLRWRETRDGVPVRHSSEPEATLKRRIPAWVIGWLPIESQL